MYPAQSLVVIAPIIFIVLMVAIPIVGYFMGWKRALFWGTGNLIFYIIGFVIWLFAGKAIGEAIAPLLQKSISALKDADLSKIATSVVAPIFFIIIMFVGNIILLINYFAWYTRVARIRREDKEAKGPAPIGAPVMKYEFTSRLIGAVSLPVLLLPSTFAFTQGLFYATTSKATRAENAFARNLYNGLDKINNKFKWFSYYKNSAADLDALWAGLSLNDTQVKITLPDGTPFEGNLTDALSQTFTQGFTKIYEVAVEDKKPTEDVIKTIKDMGTAWNDIVKQAGNTVAPIFASENATQLVKDMFDIGGAEHTKEIDKNTFIQIFGEDEESTSIFKTVMDAYIDLPEDQKLTTLPVSEQGLQNVSNVISEFYELSEDIREDEDMMSLFNTRMNDLMGLLFRVE